MHTTRKLLAALVQQPVIIYAMSPKLQAPFGIRGFAGFGVYLTRPIQ
jgi:hypothetical protein